MHQGQTGELKMSGGPADLPALLEEVRDMADRGGIFTIMMTIVQTVMRNEMWDMADRLRPFPQTIWNFV